MFVPLGNSQKFAIVDDGWEEDILCWKWWVHRGYARSTTSCSLLKTQIYLQRLIMGDKPGFEIDHINGDKLDNRTANLRHVTRTQQNWNRRTDRNQGVYWHANRAKWIAAIGINGKNKYIGLYKTIEEARAARAKAERQLYGEYARKETAL